MEFTNKQKKLKLTINQYNKQHNNYIQNIVAKIFLESLILMEFFFFFFFFSLILFRGFSKQVECDKDKRKYSK